MRLIKQLGKIFALLFVGAAAAFSVQAANLVVTNNNDTGAGSLRAQIAAAVAGDTITFLPSFFNVQRNIDLVVGQLDINKNLTINGTGARLLTVRRSTAGGTANFRVFDITGGANVTISGMTISNGNETAGGINGGGGIRNNASTLTLDTVAVSGNNSTLSGGGISNYLNSTTTILNSTISGNTSSQYGGGIGNSGTLTIFNSTISGNTTPGNGGGGGIDTDGTVNLNNVTITLNTTTNGNAGNAGGVARFGGSVISRNTIIAGNIATGSPSQDVIGAFVSNGNNLIGSTTGSSGFGAAGDKLNQAAMLGALTNNGGQTDTHAPLLGSPAIDAGQGCVVNASCAGNNPPQALPRDQRGSTFVNFLRRVDQPVANTGGSDGTDIGAVEVQILTGAGVTVSGRIITSSGRGLSSARVTLTDQNGNTRTVQTSGFGYYRFTEVSAGETYFIEITSKQHSFAPQVIAVTGELEDLNFTAN